MGWRKACCRISAGCDEIQVGQTACKTADALTKPLLQWTSAHLTHAELHGQQTWLSACRRLARGKTLQDADKVVLLSKEE